MDKFEEIEVVVSLYLMNTVKFKLTLGTTFYHTNISYVVIL